MSYYTRVIRTQNYTPPQQLRSELDWNTICNQGPFLSNRDVETTRANTIIISSEEESGKSIGGKYFETRLEFSLGISFISKRRQNFGPFLCDINFVCIWPA